MKRILIAILLVVILVAGVYEWLDAKFVAPGPKARSGAQTVVLILPRAGLHGIAKKLAAAGVVDDPFVFEAGVRMRFASEKLKAGEYAVPSRASMLDIMDILIAGISIQHKLTAAEGLTSAMIYELVENDPELKGEPGPVPAEGTLLPETYLFTHGTTRSEILERMRQAQKKLVDALWARRAQNLPIKSEHDAIVLASVVEKETAIAEERRHIAAVFENRLRIGMKLQSDPTIIYGITKGYPLGRGIRESEINAATPYNTYVIPGLPATPICNPGRDAIAAVLNPETTKDLYFVANGTGGHVFAQTAAEQSRNVAAWRRIEARQKGATTDSRKRRER